VLPGQLEINWRYFSLYQINHEGDKSWKIWEQPLVDDGWEERNYAPSLRAFWAAEAARRQGSEAFARFHLALGRTRYQQGLSYAQPETMQLAAEIAQLDLGRFQAALADPTCMERLAADHTQADGMDIFGTPTFAFPEARPAYLKLSHLPEPEEALAFWHEFRQIVAERSFVTEIKRPH
jgi:protein-disulfide isomerase